MKEVILQSHDSIKMFEDTSFINLEIWLGKPLTFKKISKVKGAIRVKNAKLIFFIKTNASFLPKLHLIATLLTLYEYFSTILKSPHKK